MFGHGRYVSMRDRFTQDLVEAGNLLDIRILDHVVFGHGRYVSMRDRRLGFE